MNKDEYEVSKVNVNDTLLSYLRQNGQTDVKQMCEEGGCGACSIIEMVNTERPSKWFKKQTLFIFTSQM